MDKKYLLINSRKHGFFSIFLHTLDRIIYSDLNNLIPVINWKTKRLIPHSKIIPETINNILLDLTLSLPIIILHL